MKIRKINKTNSEYPTLLKEIFNPPRELFIKGSIILEDACAIAIVGTRTPTAYGIKQCEKISCELAKKGITIVSGMARGIDSVAHKSAIKAGGRTIAILGSGLNRIYPPENKKLYEDISKNGAVISEFAPNTPPMPYNFPKRNRIISGMAIGVVVVEAAVRSGSLITANFALEQGRDVFAMPGNINSPRSNGTNALIKDGAKLVEDVSDVLNEFEYKKNFVRV